MVSRLGLKLLALFCLIALASPGLRAEEVPLSTLDLLKKLISIDTTNPPGNEIAAAEFVKNYLAGFGIAAEIFESAPGRANLVARISGSGKREPLLLLGHLDVVPADPKEWKYPPFEATVEGDYLYGRGAIDMKSLVALEIQTFIRLKREAAKLEGDVILALVADEEAGGKMGAGFLVDQHWDQVKAKYVFNEGSIGFNRKGMHLYPIQVAEKGVAWMRLTAHGTSGHGSMPSRDNATVKLIRALNRLAKQRQPLEKTAIAQEFLTRLSEQFSFPRSFFMRHLFDWPISPIAVRFFGGTLEKEKILNAMLRNTVVPTVLKAGNKTNVIPAEAVAEIDCRLLPGETPEAFREKIRDRLDDPDISIDWIQENPASESDFHTPFFDAIEGALRKNDPQAVVVPLLSPGATDNRFFRAKGAIAYGIIPVMIQPEDLEGLHGKNERVPIPELQRGEKILWDIVLSLQTESK
ncbi:MAG: M20/M25/M40 family metallo-hydrolase [Deltaproteobacteria bacterium]|nr:M20/M25/M40 family metallo-hydrolase [Deltaproteobacteria bacterium]